MAIVNTSVTAIWLPTGLSIASLLIFGYKLLPAIFLGAFSANLATQGTVLTSLGIATGNTLEAFIGVFLVNKFALGKSAFYEPINIFKYTFLAGLISPLISAGIGTLTLYLGNLASPMDLRAVFLTWWLGDMTSALILAPLLIIWIKQPLPKWHFKKIIEAIIIIFVAIVATEIIFGVIPFYGLESYKLYYLIFPIILWVAFRFGRHETILLIIIIASIALLDTIYGRGAFSGLSSNESLLLLQVFMAVLAVTKLIVASLVTKSNEIQKRLEIALEREKELDALKDEFVTMASHDLRTPMAAIKGLLSMIFEGSYGNVDEGLKKPLKNIGVSIERLIELTNDLLDVSRIESGGLSLSLKAVDIRKTIFEIVESLEPISKEKNVTLSLAEYQEVLVNADPGKIKEIFINLLSNSLKFTANGKISITFKKEDTMLKVRVSDTGTGIKEEDKPKLFKKFTQITTVQRVLNRGSGLGLYISRELARKMGGDLYLEHSEEGKGSTFVLTLPLT